MEEINTNQTTPEEQQAQTSHEEEMIKVAEQLEQSNDPDRPDWLPDKFKDVEQMAQAYKHLEAKLGSNNQEQEQEEVVQEEVVEEQVVNNAPSTDEVAEVINASGLDYNAMQEEYNETGELSQATMDSLAEKGFSNELVNSWVQGQQALLDNFQDAVFNSVGGKEAYGEMQKWASDNLSESEIQAFDRAVTSGDIELVKLAVSGLQTQYQSAEGSEPSLITEGQTATSSTGGTFGSWAEVTQAMQDARYESDVAYRQQVSEKLARSPLT